MYAVAPAILLSLLTALPCEIALADTCHQTIPAFSATIDSSSIPDPPAQPFSQSALEIFRVKLDLYRENSVEGYNNKLVAYSISLDRLDTELRSKCSPAEYEAVRSQIDEQLMKVRLDYLEPGLHPVPKTPS